MKATIRSPFRHASMILAISLLLAGCVSDGGQPDVSESALSADSLALANADAQTIRQSAEELGALAAQWQVTQIEKGNYDYLPESYQERSADPKLWIQAAFYVGLINWVETQGDEDLLGHIARMAEKQNYQLGPRPLHADDHTIGQIYLWLYEQTDNTAAYGPTQARFDDILSDPPTNSLKMVEANEPGYEGTCQDRWCWSDALFMAPRTWLKLSNATGDERYFEYGDSEYWATTDFLFSNEHGMFYRDSRYFDIKSDNGKPMFWSRGNGWVYAALPLIMEDLPEGHPSRKRFMDLYKKMSYAMVRAQKPDGYWAPSLLDPGMVTTPETSGTGFITSGLAWGVNNDVLNDTATIEAVKKGWSALAAAVDANGKLHWVQQVGKSPDPVQEHETQLYGVGAFLLAAAEMTQWQK